MPGAEFFAAYLPELAAGLSGSLLAALPRGLRRILQSPQREDAIERCSVAAVAALVAAAETSEGEEQTLLLEIFKSFFTGSELAPEVGKEVAELLRGQRLPRETFAELFEEAGFDATTLPGLDLRQALTAFESAFLLAATQERSLREEIQLHQISTQTEIQRQTLERMEALLQAVQGIRETPLSPGSVLQVGSIDAQNVVGGTQIIIHQWLSRAPEEKAPGAEREPQALRGYLRRLWAKAGKLDLAGVDPALADAENHHRPVRLQGVYVGLRCTAPGGEPRALEERDPRAMERERNRALPSALELLDRHRRLVLLGDPGGGKSTFVSYLSLCLAGETLGENAANLETLTEPLPEEKEPRSGKTEEPEPQPWSHGALIPVRMILKDFAAEGLPKQGEKGTAQHLWAFLEKELDKAEHGETTPLLKRALGREEGGVLLLLDGLDEVPAPHEQRQRLLECIQDFSDSFSGCHILVTSRPYAYQERRWQLEGFSTASLAPFDRGQISRFVDRWYQQVGPRRALSLEEIEGQAADLHRRIFNNDRLEELAARPLLLTLLSGLHSWKGGTLPERRQQLYEEVVVLLLDRWEQKRQRWKGGKLEILQEGFQELLKVKPARVRALLQGLAFKAHGAQPVLQGTADIPEESIAAGLLRLASGPDFKKARPQLLLPYLRDRAGLLVDRGSGVYAFPHRSIQEYLAACDLTSQEGFSETAADLAVSEPDRWREVVLLAAAKVQAVTADSFWGLIRELCHKAPAEATEGDLKRAWGAQVAGKAIEEAELPDLTESQTDQIQTVRLWLAANTRGPLPVPERIEAGRLLGTLGEPDDSLTNVDKLELCWVPQGRFWFSGLAKEEDEGPQAGGWLKMPYPYWIGRFPVTQGQFGEFVKAGGYRETDLWKEAIEGGYWEDGKITLPWAKETRSTPREYGAPFDHQNHPVVGITWYEALAFCRWLTRRARSQEMIPQTWSFCLPSETEWEQAARGGEAVLEQGRIRSLEAGIGLDLIQGVETVPNVEESRAYPWGSDLETEESTGRGNFGGAAETTSRPGTFPTAVSPAGCEELAGNVWEWSRSVHGKIRGEELEIEGMAEAMKTELEADGDKECWLLGSSYYNSSSSVGCSARDRGVPNRMYVNVGFRVVLLPFPSGL